MALSTADWLVRWCPKCGGRVYPWGDLLPGQRELPVDEIGDQLRTNLTCTQCGHTWRREGNGIR